jgi:hypothetical protein
MNAIVVRVIARLAREQFRNRAHAAALDTRLAVL